MLHRGAYAIVLSRRITDADGRFAGVVAGSIRFTYFHELFGRLQLGGSDTICVLRRDRTIIMRRPFDLDVIGRRLGDMPRGATPAQFQNDAFSGLGPVDDVPRLYVRGPSTSPLFVVVGKPLNDIFDLWRTEAIRIGAIMMALIVFVLAVTLFLAREIRRRAEAEDKLEELATTDSLTGLRNRRKFDEAIEEEWRRAIRSRAPLSLLMIDADHFKAFNDTYGHQAGDQVLVGIAICISDSVRRAGDCTARFGGEEFAVLLPGNTAADALAVAEAIRHKVEQWSAGPMVTTVSIGIASATPPPACTGPISGKPPTRRSTSPRPMAATSPWSPACRNCRWWREAPPVMTRHPVRPSAGRMTGSTGIQYTALFRINYQRPDYWITRLRG